MERGREGEKDERDRDEDMGCFPFLQGFEFSHRSSDMVTVIMRTTVLGNTSALTRHSPSPYQSASPCGVIVVEIYVVCRDQGRHRYRH